VYEIALSVSACLRAGTRVDVAWVVETRGFSSRDKSEALAITPGGGRVGSVLSGALHDQLADQAATGRLVDLTVSDLSATLAGLSCGGDARCLLVPAADLPAELWQRLLDREPVCLVTRLDGDRVVGTALLDAETVETAGEDAARLFARGVSDTIVAADSVITVLWPVPQLVIVGGGGRTHRTTDTSTATGLIARLAVLDKLVVTSHDDDVAGPALASALGGQVGYIGALGSRRTQQSRADWLAFRGITDLERVHGPAGLDIGANTPAEIAVSIVAEALSVANAVGASSLRAKTGAIH
jgi:xanthine dehydrogenase accessory factor